MKFTLPRNVQPRHSLVIQRAWILCDVCDLCVKNFVEFIESREWQAGYSEFNNYLVFAALQAVVVLCWVKSEPFCLLLSSTPST